VRQPPSLLVVGDLIRDVIVRHRGDIKHATDNDARISQTRGGSAANVAVNAARSGVSVRFVGKVGNDEAGRDLVHSLERVGIETRMQVAGRTGTIVVLVDPVGERSMFVDRGASAELDQIDRSTLDGIRWLHLTMYSAAIPSAEAHVVEFAAVASDRGVKVSLDTSSTGLLCGYGIDRFWDLVYRIQPSVIFANEPEAEYIGISTHNPSRDQIVVIKRGSKPVNVVTCQGAFHFPVPPVTGVIDTTGAGDAFAAHFIGAQLAGESIAESVRRGSQGAGRAITHVGA